MRERLFRGDVFEQERSRREDFDPIAEGKRHGLPSAVSAALWEKVHREATNADGVCDERAAQERFVQLAELVGSRGGKLGPEPFHWTQVDVASGHVPTDNAPAKRVPGKTTRVLSEEAAHARVRAGVPGRTTLVASQAVSEVGSLDESRGFFRRYLNGGLAACAKLERAVAARDHYAAVVAIGVLKQDLASARRHLANGLEGDEGLRVELAALEGPAEQMFAKLPNMCAGGLSWELWGPSSAEWRAALGEEVAQTDGLPQAEARDDESRGQQGLSAAPQSGAERAYGGRQAPPRENPATPPPAVDRLGRLFKSSRTGSAAPIRRDSDDAAVLEIATGLDEHELAGEVATQPRGLQANRADGAGKLAWFPAVAAATADGAHAVQRKAVPGEVPTSAPKAVASKGFQGGGGPLPHLEKIQHSFGRHDVSDVRAHQGSVAQQAAAELGAEAYASGRDIAFSEAPSLRTAAHEAAHVVQQRAGVQLVGGIDGGAHDPYEQHADQVADKVVRGESAEGLLDAFVGTGGAPVVQRKAGTPSGMVNARRYLELNAFRAGEAIAQHLLQQRLPQPHPRLEWRNEKLFYQQLLFGLSGILKFQSPYDVAQLLAPGDPYSTVDQLRPLTGAVEAADSKDDMQGGPVGPWAWSPPVGLAIAQLVEQALIDSMYRLGPRYLAIADTLRSDSITVDPERIARSHPMDRFTVGPLCQPGVLTVIPDGKPKRSTATPDAKRPITLTWVGRQDKALWNWVRASPADATAEEVSAALFAYMTSRDHETRADYYATFLTAAPPMFGIPPQWAKTFEETKDFRPAKIDAADTDPDHQVVALGGSAQGDAQALAEVGAAAPDAKAKTQSQPATEHDNLVADATAQATALKSMLAGWKLGDAADKTLAFLARRRADGTAGATWMPVLSAERENLTRIASGILQMNAAIDQMQLSKTSEQAAPLREVMRFYADATACAHLNQSCNRLIVRAANAQTSLTARGLGASLHDMDTSVDMMQSGVDPNDYDRRQLSATAAHLRDQGTAMQTKMMRGGNVSAEEIEELQIRVEETALEAKLAAVDFSLGQLESAADEAGAGLASWFASRFSSKFRSLPEATQKIHDQISDIRFEWNKAKHNADMPDDKAEVHEKENLRKAVETAKHRFAELAKQQDLNEFLREGANVVKWQQFRTACVKLAALIGISLVGGVIGGMVARGVAGMMMGTGGAVAMENLAVGGALVARGAGLATETAIQSIGQSAIFDDKLGTSFLENMIMNLGSAGVMKMIGENAADAMRIDKAVGGMWSKAAYGGKVVLAESATISGHLIMGVAMGYIAHKMVTGESQPPPATVQEWLLQGASIAVGRYVGHGIATHAEARKKLAAVNVEGSAKLEADARTLAALSKQAEHNPQASDAMALLAKRHQLLTEELKVLETLEQSPAKMKAAKLTKGEVAKTKGELESQLAESHADGFAEVALHTSGMRELIPGTLWSGTELQVTELITKARESGISASAAKDPQGGRWRVKVGAREIVVEERVSPTGQPKVPAGHSDHDHVAPSPTHEGAASAVPHSNFAGNKGTKALTLEDIPSPLQGACALLNGAHANEGGPELGHSSPKTPFFDAHGSTDVLINAGNDKRIRVHIEIMPATEDVARHNFKDANRSTATIWISERARPNDLTRALAHELAEIQSIAAGAPIRAGARGAGLDAHQYGRKAEVHTLLFEIDQATRTATPKTDQSSELKALVTHMGFEPDTIGSNAEAKRVLGAKEVARIDEVLNKPRIVLKPTVAHPKGKMIGRSWVFDIDVNVPGEKRSVEVVTGSITMKPDPTHPGKFLVDETQTLDFVIKKTTQVNGREMRIEVEGHKQLTDYVIKEAVSQFEAEFHEKPVLSGMLAWENRATFQHAYAEIEDAALQAGKKLTPQQIADQAILKTKYGEARDKAGYRVTATVSGTTEIVTGDPPRLATVPDHIEALARPKEKGQ